MKQQNYNNHRQIVYSYYLLTGVPIIILLVLAIKRISVAHATDQESNILFLLIAWILLTMLFKSRSFALKAQDRAIRAEENLRHLALTGKLLDNRLTLTQVIALRFASDAELPALAQKAAEQQLSNTAIKKEIKNWRADLRRV